MTYKETIDYLLGQLPMFQRIGAAAYRKDLDNIIKLCDILGNPQKDLRCIHVAGTNGKGSVTHIIASILQEQGYRTGVFVSPHYKDYRERIKINGKLIGKEFIRKFVERNIDKFKSLNASFFEITNAMAFDYFKGQKVDFAVIETGMGGRLDSTNIITPLISVITNISFDHQQFLGDTLPLIAAEKAGIIKPGIPVVIGETLAETKPVFAQKAKAVNAEIYFADKTKQPDLLHNSSNPLPGRGQGEDKTPNYARGLQKNYKSGLTGPYQRKNITTALMAIEILRKQGIEILEKAIERGLKKVVSNTGFTGRWMIKGKHPLVIFDSAHNEGGIKQLVTGLKDIKYKKLHFVYGTVNDKDISKILSMLPKDGMYYFCKANIPRGLDAKELELMAAKYSLTGNAYPSVKGALKAAIANAAKNDAVMVAGSVFVVAEVI